MTRGPHVAPCENLHRIGQLVAHETLAHPGRVVATKARACIHPDMAYLGDQMNPKIAIIYPVLL